MEDIPLCIYIYVCVYLCFYLCPPIHPSIFMFVKKALRGSASWEWVWGVKRIFTLLCKVGWFIAFLKNKKHVLLL